MHIELVVFDMAGTTVQDDGAVARCFAEAIADVGVHPTPAAIAAVMGWAKPQAIAHLLRGCDRAPTPALVTRVHDDFVARMVGHYQDMPVREAPGAAQLLFRLKSQGVKVALDTGFSRPIADMILARLGWSTDDILDAVVTSDEVPRGRPHPDMIFEAMVRTGVRSAWRVAKVGDTPSDLLEGSVAGCSMVVGVTRSGTHDAASLGSFPHTHLVDSVADLLPALRDAASDPRVFAMMQWSALHA